jgi:hypothetical protein
VTAAGEVVTVEVERVATTRTPPRTQVGYRVRNDGRAPVWLVDDEWFTWRHEREGVEIARTREPLRPGAQVAGYFPPQVVEVGPGSSVRRVLTLEWPQRLSRLWNDAAWACPHPGTHLGRIVVGYGRTPAPPPPTSAAEVEAVVLGWQERAASAEVLLDVPAYDPPDEPCGDGP